MFRSLRDIVNASNPPEHSHRPGETLSASNKKFTLDMLLGSPILEVVVVVVSHIQPIGCQPEKNYFTR